MTTICRKPIERYLVGTFLGVALFFSGAPAFAQPGPSFQGFVPVPDPNMLPQFVHTLVLGFSANGLVVVGDTESSDAVEQAFRWELGSGTLLLGPSSGAVYSMAKAASGDGSIVVGVVRVLDQNRTNRAFRWTSSAGMVFLGDLPGGVDFSIAGSVSMDGSVIIGISESASGTEAFRWTQAEGMVGLGDLPGGTFESVAGGVSADGSVVVGGSVSAAGFEAFRWTADQGMVGLGVLPGGFSSGANAVSADGLVVVGSGRNSQNNNEAFRWTAADGMVGLGDLPGGQFKSSATDVSADGTVIVGWSFAALHQEAFIWDPVNGMRNLKSVLENEIGLDLTGWHLSSASGVSDDGRVIAGNGSYANDIRFQAWTAVLNECGTDADCSDGLFCNGVETCVNNVCTPGAPPCAANDPCVESAGVCTSTIPTVSQWGLIAMALLLVAASTCVLKRRTVPGR